VLVCAERVCWFRFDVLGCNKRMIKKESNKIMLVICIKATK
jgi:hypothetical protein